MSVLHSKDVLGRPPKAHSIPRPEGLQNVQESAYDTIILGGHEIYVLILEGLENHRGLGQVSPHVPL